MRGNTVRLSVGSNGELHQSFLEDSAEVLRCTRTVDSGLRQSEVDVGAAGSGGAGLKLFSESSKVNVLP